jgi:hypothetical protein
MPGNFPGATKTKKPVQDHLFSAVSDSEEVKMDTSDDDFDTKRPHKKRAMSVNGS